MDMERLLFKSDIFLGHTTLSQKAFLLENCQNLKQLYMEQTDFDEDFHYLNMQFENETRQLSISIATWYHDVAIDVSSGINNKSSVWMSQLEYFEIYKHKILFFEGSWGKKNTQTHSAKSVLECDLTNLSVTSRMNL